jgi:hypothetical protein
VDTDAKKIVAAVTSGKIAEGAAMAGITNVKKTVAAAGVSPVAVATEVSPPWIATRFAVSPAKAVVPIMKKEAPMAMTKAGAGGAHPAPRTADALPVAVLPAATIPLPAAALIPGTAAPTPATVALIPAEVVLIPAAAALGHIAAVPILAEAAHIPVSSATPAASSPAAAAVRAMAAEAIPATAVVPEAVDPMAKTRFN